MTKIISKRGKKAIQPEVVEEDGCWPFVYVEHELTAEDMEVLERTLRDVDITYIPFDDYDGEDETHSLRKVAEIRTIDVIMYNQTFKVVVR
jgi:hypothetical protein